MSQQALRRLFKEFYFKNSEKVEIPRRMEEREFGYVPFGGSMIRHLSFKRPGELTATLIREVPSAFYYSCAFYIEPSLPMEEKGWKGADLIFDIDADDLNMPCKKEHDLWACRGCGLAGLGLRPEGCPSCGGARVEETNFACQACLEAARQEALKLLDILVEDLGLSSSQAKTYFSGCMGFHVVVEGSPLEGIGQLARSELADYALGLGFAPESLGISKMAAHDEIYNRLPLATERGWRGRIARYFEELEIEGYEGRGGDVREKVFFLYGKAGYSRFKEILQEAVKRVGVAIDTSVTTDVHRVFRLPGTLHGETGLLKKACRDILSFEPFTDAVAFGDEPMEVFVNYAPRFVLRGQAFGPFKPEKVRLPLMAAVYLMGRGLARAI